MRKALPLVFSVCCSLLTGCETSEPTQAVFDNDYARSGSDPGFSEEIVVYKAWWSVAQLTEPVGPGNESDPVRIVPGTDFAYALLAPGWDRESGAPPSALIPVRTRGELTAARGETLRVPLSDATTLGNCAGVETEPLAQADADFITQRIFPAEFSNLSYDAATCVAVPSAVDGPAGGAGAPNATDHEHEAGASAN